MAVPDSDYIFELLVVVTAEAAAAACGSQCSADLEAPDVVLGALASEVTAPDLRPARAGAGGG